MIVLQSTAATQWQGASDFDNSLMMGGYIETDYDVIYNSSARIISRYNRDMLILEDSGWIACIFVNAVGQVVIAQLFSGDLLEYLKQIPQMEPSETHTFNVEDASLRLLVGAENGAGIIYGFKDVPIEPGEKRCDIYFNSDFLIITID